MRYLPGRETMQYIEDHTIRHIGIPSLALMERAALAVTDVVLKLCHAKSRVLVCCGVGNNGADGLAVARMLYMKNIFVEVHVVGDIERGTQEFRTQLSATQHLGVTACTGGPCEEYIRKERYDIIIDALFGIGLTRPISGEWYDLIELINQSNAYVVSVDMPSGISADNGKVMGKAVRADLTVTFGYEKLGLAMYPGKEYAGQVQICDIGLVETDFFGLHAYTYDRSDLKNILPYRAERTNKGDFGKVLVVAGSKNMSGAAYLAAKAAYRMGAGLVRIFTPEENREILQSSLPEAILSTYSSDDFTINGLQELCDWADSIVIGPGLGSADYVRSLVNYILQYSRVPIVLDADALNMIAKNPNMNMLLSNRMIVTPHLMEMSRLTGRAWHMIRETMVETAMSYSRTTGVVCVLKDARTVVSNGRERFYLNTSGNCGMATAGSGDVLSGILGALLAIQMQPMDAAALGVYIHGLAGDAAAAKCGTYAMMATDIIEGLSEVTRM